MPVNPKSLKNLIPPKEGEIRNPNGNGGWSKNWRTHIEKFATENDMVDASKMLIALAKEGNLDAIKFLLEKTFPKDEKSTEINITIDDIRSKLLQKLDSQT